MVPAIAEHIAVGAVNGGPSPSCEDIDTPWENDLITEVDMERISKEMLGLAGEYAVASELCKRGLYSQLTLGNHKRTDILVETETRMLRISVKAKQGNEWPSISGPAREDDFIVFVDFAGKGEADRLGFYVLGQDDWKRLRNRPGITSRV